MELRKIRWSAIRAAVIVGALVGIMAAPGCQQMLMDTADGRRASEETPITASPPSKQDKKKTGALAYNNGSPASVPSSPSVTAREKSKDRYGYFPPAHGGTTPPNAAAYDAMFFETHGVNPFIDTEDNRLSTFAIDVDTASYTVSRNYIFRGNLPPKEAVRVEEFVNYFKYDYPAPDGDAFSIHMEGAPSRFGGANYKLLRIGIKGKNIRVENRKDAILTFVIDVSGSMARENRLGLVKKSLRLLVDQLREGDQVAIVVYGSRGRVIMEHKGIERKSDILRAIEMLRPEGATNADEGLELGYELADEAFERGAINRIILCSDGVANMGETGAEGILKKIERHAKKGITLTAVGFGISNYNDVLMEKLADKGDGNYAYVDNLSEARRVFVENLTGTLQVIAKDVKIQVEFNADVVARYRLLGYENRDIKDEDFRNDKVDAGEIGAGHQVTALYEIKLHKKIESGNVATVRVRYKNPDHQNEVNEVSRKFKLSRLAESFDSATPSFRLAAAVAELAEILRKSYWAKDGELPAVMDVAQSLPREYRKKSEVIEFMDLVGKATKLRDTESSN